MDYANAPQAKIPSQQMDVIKVIEYARHNSLELGIDKDNICLFGSSAGGNIATGALKLMTSQKKAPGIQLLILLQPMLNDYIFTTPED